VNCEDPEYPLLTIFVGEVRDKDAAIEQLCDAKMKSMTQLLQLLASVSWTLVSRCLSVADCRCNIRRNSRSNTRNRGSVAEWLAWWTQAQKGPGANRSRDAVCFRQTVHTHRASVHQAAKLVAALLRVATVTVGLAESNGSLPPGLWLTSPAG